MKRSGMRGFVAPISRISLRCIRATPFQPFDQGRQDALHVLRFAAVFHAEQGRRQVAQRRQFAFGVAAILILAFVVPPLGGLGRGRPPKGGTTNGFDARFWPKRESLPMA
jgi:hypothetical protein